MRPSTALLFDLDDTLYLEESFFRSGFQVVAHELAIRGNASEPSVEKLLLALHRKERDRVFDRAAHILGFPAEWIEDLVRRFRSHEPNIALALEVPAVLEAMRERSVALGIVTDGHGDVQRRKIARLGVERFVDVVVVADDFGRQHWKPDPYPMLRCLRALEVQAADATLVGDHPERDVLGAANAGLRCVRIRRPDGYFSTMPTPGPTGSCPEITDLTGLDHALRTLGS